MLRERTNHNELVKVLTVYSVYIDLTLPKGSPEAMFLSVTTHVR